MDSRERENRRAQYASEKSAGVCVSCHCAAAEPGKTMCASCAAKTAARQRMYTGMRKKEWDELYARLLQLEEENAELKRRLSERGEEQCR